LNLAQARVAVVTTRCVWSLRRPDVSKATDIIKMIDYSASDTDYSADDRRRPATTGSLADTIDGWLGGTTWGTIDNTEEGRLQRLEDRLQRLEAGPEAEVSSLISRLKLELKTELDEEVESAMRSLNTIITDKMEIALEDRAPAGRPGTDTPCAHGAILGRLDDRLNEACTQLNHQTRRQEILTQSLEETLTSVADMKSHIAKLELECAEHKRLLEASDTQHQEVRDLVLTQSIKDVFDSVRELEQFVVKAETKREEHQGRFNSLDAKHLEFKKLTETYQRSLRGMATKEETCSRIEA